MRKWHYSLKIIFDGKAIEVVNPQNRDKSYHIVSAIDAMGCQKEIVTLAQRELIGIIAEYHLWLQNKTKHFFFKRLGIYKW